jgi:hypothetical protein
MAGKNFGYAMAIAAVAAAVLWPVVSAEFINYDDPKFVTQNTMVRSGLTGEGFVWALTSSHSGYLHPVTWLSHMLDCELFGLGASKHHAVNLAIHSASAALLYVLLMLLTGRVGPSVLVAVLFAIHPMHVESVAWISERKSLLSTFFAILSMIAYSRYAARGGAFRYITMTFLFALGIMSKPILVTYPAMLFLLDYWPLDRIRQPGQPEDDRRRSVQFLILEKTPIAAICIVWSVFAYLHQVSIGAMSTTAVVSVSDRLINAIVSCGRYIWKLFIPTDLSVLYPHPSLPGMEPWETWRIFLSAAVVCAISVLVYLTRRRRYPVMGWLWFLSSLVPVIGLVQIGSVAMADRYTYVSYIGLFIMIAWGIADLLARLSDRPAALRRMILWTVCGWTLVCAGMARAQTFVWKDSSQLFGHALTIDPNNVVMLNNLGSELCLQERYDDAVRILQKALSLHPSYAEAHYNLAFAYKRLKRIRDAEEHFHRSILLKSSGHKAYFGLANLLGVQGRFDEAIPLYESALEIGGPLWRIHLSLANALFELGRLDEAVKNYRLVLEGDPGNSFAIARLRQIDEMRGAIR